MKKSVISIVVASFVTGIFGLEPSELVRLRRASFTNNVTKREISEWLTKNPNLLSEITARMNGIELLLMCGSVGTVSSTPTSLIITFRADWHMVRRNDKNRRTGEYVENNEALIVTPDEEVEIAEYGSGIRLTPISFKDGKKGFRVMSGNNKVYPCGGMKHDFGYIALGDTPTPMSADDVEMIWESRLDNTGNPTGWKRFEGDQVMAYPPPLETPPVQAKPPEPPPEPPAVTPPE